MQDKTPNSAMSAFNSELKKLMGYGIAKTVKGVAHYLGQNFPEKNRISQSSTESSSTMTQQFAGIVTTTKLTN